MFQCVSEWRIQYSERRSRPAETADVEITSEALTLARCPWMVEMRAGPVF